LKQTIPPDLSALERFFTVFEKDMDNTSKVISEQELIKNLTHLQRMNLGGNKYYPLERESLTKMIRELASYEYSECVLINKSGMIIYSMVDDKLFSVKAETFTKHIGIIFNHAKKGTPYIFDTSVFPVLSGEHRILFGMPVIRNGDTEGVIIAALKASDAVKISGVSKSIVDSEGVIRLDANDAKILTQCEDCSSPEDLRKNYIPFNYRNLQWFIKK
jgi:hypothetical protein